MVLCEPCAYPCELCGELLNTRNTKITRSTQFFKSALIEIVLSDPTKAGIDF